MIVGLERMLDGHNGGCIIDPATKIGGAAYSSLLSKNHGLRAEMIRLQKPSPAPAPAPPASTSLQHYVAGGRPAGDVETAAKRESQVAMQNKILELSSRRETLHLELNRTAEHAANHEMSDTERLELMVRGEQAAQRERTLKTLLQEAAEVSGGHNRQVHVNGVLRPRRAAAPVV